ncbi:ATP-binding protein [Stenotrophomonas sp. NA06056]|uniref:ATP-binding protein n=1 Tax=Stenotrophomonas sp. NA06056 TaxID=2742129 RepID=UPI00158CE6DD|nr:ATP-binding protein [Stenotrophomonas sp. NA06056]QKW55409.1 HAMP domain-containing protein [Stenotrophomonas sp. NA06056]
MSEVASRRWRFPWPRSLMWQNLLLLVGLAVVIHACVLGVHLLLLRVSVIHTVSVVSNQLKMIDGSLSMIDPGRRSEAIAFLARHDLVAIEGAPPPASDQPIGPRPYAELAGSTIQRSLEPDIRFQWTHPAPGKGPVYWVQLNVAGKETWFRSSFRTSSNGQDPRLVSILLVLGLSALATVVAFFIQRRINRPLRDIGAATRTIREGGGQAHLPQYATSELSGLAEQFNAMVDSLRQAEATRAMMLAGISHDIRTPLARLRLALALQGGESEAMAARCISQVDAIIGQFLDFGHAGNGEPPMECDLNVLVQQTAAEFEAEGHPFALQLRPLPLLVLRPIAMQRVIQNLMDNALKYAGKGLQVSTWMEDGDVHLAVADRGAGLAAAERTRVRQAFVRGADSAGAGGLGLGLAIVERLLQLHGGRLQLLGRDGGGVEARVTLPGVAPGKGG